MNRLLAALSLSLIASPAFAAAPVDLGARVGVGFPGGEYGFAAGGTSGDQDQSLVVSIDGSLKLSEGVKVGAFASLVRPRYDTNRATGPGPAASIAGSSYRLEASVLGLQLGARAALELGATTVLGFAATPWGAASVGWERLSFSYDATLYSGTGDASLSPTKTWSGFFAGLEAGLEFPVSPALSVGPCLAFSFGKFSHVEVDGTGVTATSTGYSTWSDRSTDIDADVRAVHTMTSLGIRGRFTL
jgi:hypothetical protein